MTGLVIGSMVPDFEYFFRMKIQSNYSHSLAGIFWFDLPLAILLAFIFHNIVRTSLFNNLPLFLKSRFVTWLKFDWNVYFKKNWLIVILSILTGSASHIFWDSFTHVHGYFVEKIPALTHDISLHEFQIPVFKIIQHSSSLIGALVIASTIFKLPKHESATRKSGKAYWGILSGIVIMIISIRILVQNSIQFDGNLIVTAISAGIVALLITPMLMKSNCNN